jgi:hypothetical protein
LKLSALSVLGALAGPAGARGDARPVTLCLCGDVMTGRGLDQVLPHPGDPQLHEPWARSARAYVELAEGANGAIAKPVAFAYPWGDALAEVARVRPDAWIANLETAVTASGDRAAKGIHYRMHPANAACLAASGVDLWTLANNHVLDWGRSGLLETLATLRAQGLRSAGAGRDAAEAGAPALLPSGGGARVIVLAFGSVTSGIPEDWAAAEGRPGVNLLEGTTAAEIGAGLRRAKRPGDIVVASIHWGGNWGYGIPPPEGDRGASGPADPVRLRRLPERLRGHRGLRGVPGRARAALLRERRPRDRQARPPRDDAVPAGPLPPEPGLGERAALAAAGARSRLREARHARRGDRGRPPRARGAMSTPRDPRLAGRPERPGIRPAGRRRERSVTRTRSAGIGLVALAVAALATPSSAAERPNVVRVLAEMFSDAGYATALFGK